MMAVSLAAAGCGSSVARHPAVGREHAATSQPSRVPSNECGPQPPRHAWAFDVSDFGHVGWETALPTHGSNPSPVVQPVVAGSTALFAQDGAVYALSLSDGKRLWARRGGQIVYGMWVWHGLLAVLTDQVSTHGRLTGLNAATGKVRWVVQLPGRGLLGSQVQTPDGGLAFVGAGGHLQVVNLSDGKVRWSRHVGSETSLGAADGLVMAASNGRMQAFGQRTGRIQWMRSGLPALPVVQVQSGLALVLSNAQGPSISTALVAVRPTTGRVAWRFDPRMPVTVLSSGPAGLAVATYVPDRRLYLLDPSTGHPRWRASTAVADGTLPLVTRHDVVAAVGGVAGFPALRLVSRNATSGVVRWVRTLPGSPIGAVAQAGADVIVQTNSRPGSPSPLLSYRLATGAPAWRVRMPAFVQTSALPAGRGLLVQASDLVSVCDLAATR
jgi:outer membrane protein assembly factor BamB